MEKKFWVVNRRGLKLAGVMAVPEGLDRFPTVMLLHGFKGYKEEETYTTLAKELAQKGVGSVRFDASGFGESEGTIERDYRFSNYASDTEAVYEWFKSQDGVEKARIGVCGQSMGGLMALVFASKHPEVKAVGMISSPDLIGEDGELAAEIKGWRETGTWETTSSKYGPITVPYAWLTDAQKFRGSEYSVRVKQPSLYVLGLADKTVTPAQTRKVFQAANEPKELVEIAGMDHFYKRQPEILAKINRIVVGFLVKQLK